MSGARRTLLFAVMVAGLISWLFTGHSEPSWPLQQMDDYVLNVVVLAGINVLLAVSLNMVNGHTGQFSLGHAGFMAVGAYVSSAVTMGAPRVLGIDAVPGSLMGHLLFFLALIIGGAAAAVAGVLVGVPSLRLRGDYLAIVTLGFGEIIKVVIQNTDALGGPRGINGIPLFTSLGWTVGAAAVGIYLISAVVNSTYGRGFLGVRDDEIAAEAMGVNTTGYKVVAFVLGAFFAGVSGGLYAHFITYITPEGFSFLKSVDVIVMVILGGMGSTVGVAAAAVILTVLNELLRQVEQYRMVVFSVLLIVMMIARPQGLLAGWGAWVGEVLKRGKEGGR
jgi:branched-chain amino acid transport system permease protein